MMSETGSTYTAQDWLTAKMQILDGDGITAVLVERGISPDMPFDELTEKERDLLMASGLFAQILLCGGGSTIKEVDGSWSHSEGGWQITKADKNAQGSEKDHGQQEEVIGRDFKWQLQKAERKQ